MRALVLLLVTTSLLVGCLRPGPGRAGNKALIASGSVLMAAAIGGVIAVHANDEPMPPPGSWDHESGRDAVNTVLLLVPLALGGGLVITGARGLEMSHSQ